MAKNCLQGTAPARVSTASASGAAQPAATASASGASQSTAVRLGSFNAGVPQSMLLGKSSKRTVAKIEHIIATCVKEGLLDIFSLCELGGLYDELRTSPAGMY